MPDPAPPLILVVDDARDIREPLALYLRRQGLRARPLAGAPEARRALEEGAADLVVLDVMMPGEDGLSLCRWLAARGGPPVILLTAMADDTDRVVGLELGADDYVVKPFNPRELLARVRAVLRRAPRPPAEVPGLSRRFAGWTHDPAARTLAHEDGRRADLTSGESRLLAILPRPPARGALARPAPGGDGGARGQALRPGRGQRRGPPAPQAGGRPRAPAPARDRVGRGLRARRRGGGRAVRRLLPDGLAARFALLLAAALVAANLVALALLAAERDRLGRAARVEREVERAASLVPALEAVAPERRGAIARRASTRLTRVAVGPEPRLAATGDGPRSRALAAGLAEALPGREVRAAVLARRRPGPGGGVGAVVASIALEGGGDAQWLDVVAQAPRGGPPPVRGEVWALVTGLSLAAVLGAALLLARRLTRPLAALAAAARAAGRGDRSARVPERGARELREAAAAFNDMQGRIARLEAERTRTVAALGHDLRTPITSLRIRAEMIDEEEARAPMIRTLDEMRVMADGLVTHAQGAGEAEAETSVDLAALLRRLCAERGAEAGGIAPATIRGRPVALARAVGNLIDNALRYAGGARVSLAREGACAVLAVEDRGPGIAPERLADVQEPFVRGEGSRAAATGGAGLGLAIARAVAQSHGGTLDLANREGGGLRAALRLPVAAERGR